MVRQLAQPIERGRLSGAGLHLREAVTRYRAGDYEVTPIASDGDISRARARGKAFVIPDPRAIPSGILMSLAFAAFFSLVGCLWWWGGLPVAVVLLACSANEVVKVRSNCVVVAPAGIFWQVRSLAGWTYRWATWGEIGEVADELVKPAVHVKRSPEIAEPEERVRLADPLGQLPEAEQFLARPTTYWEVVVRFREGATPPYKRAPGEPAQFGVRVSGRDTREFVGAHPANLVSTLIRTYFAASRGNGAAYRAP